jgi:hypothetical protein
MAELQGKIQIVARQELTDADRVNEAIDGAFWKVIEVKVRQMIEQAQRAIEDSNEDREIARSQGAIRALRRVLELPEIIRKESRK